MDKLQKQWLILLIIFGAGDFITNVFTNVYLWQKSNSLITIANYNLWIFLTIPLAALVGCYIAQVKNVKSVFLLINTLLGIVMSVNFDAIINYLIEKDTNISELKEEYHAFLEIPLALGRMLPIILILVLNIKNPNDSYLALIFLVLAPIPLYMMNTFVKTKYYKNL